MAIRSVLVLASILGTLPVSSWADESSALHPSEIEQIDPGTHLFHEAAMEDAWSVAACQTEPTITPFAELLTLKLTQGSAENWAQEITPLGTGSLFGTANLVDAPFGWNAGVRAGFDRTWPQEDSRVSLYYTYFGTQATNQAAGQVYSAFLGNFFADNPDGTGFGPNYRSASVDWDVQFHTIDLEFQRTYVISPALTLRPFIGVKSGIIRQHIDSKWNGPIDSSSHIYLFNSATETLSQDFWGIGPSIGVNASIPLSVTSDHSLTAYFNPSGSLMYGNWEFSEVYQTDGLTSTTILTPSTIAINNDPIHGAATMLRLALGLEWERPGQFITTRVRLGYEAQVWLNQMQFYSYNMGRLNNLMSLQGGVLEVGFCF
ncbi:Lpg1974 family pore-forming outer membrane protein [Blastopirellula marina]|uniref:MOMP-like family protein n=1 Tax=Blastopirellula marina TaxID=124 RepID=A0A2S8GDW2_9BACT|nr:Lpg1974 family pore-forming outer membrane protein [Blastopirellula marina]PQO42431.1 hypothetical protein C5Y93_29330 [Blastopirellula marina]